MVQDTEAAGAGLGASPYGVVVVPAVTGDADCAWLSRRCGGQPTVAALPVAPGSFQRRPGMRDKPVVVMTEFGRRRKGEYRDICYSLASPHRPSSQAVDNNWLSRRDRSTLLPL